MTDSRDTESNVDTPFTRRNVLKTVGAAGTIAAFGGEAAGGRHTDRVIVGTGPGKADIAKRKANNVDKVLDFGEIGQAVIGRWPEEALNGLQNNPHVEYVERESIGDIAGHSSQTVPWGIDRVDAEMAHTNGDTATGTDIGIVDTGIDLDHDDLLPNLADPSDAGEHTALVDCNDLVHPDGNCQEDWDDDESHGTHVAGTADAVDNSIDVIGVATEATLHAIKVCDGGGDCPCGEVADGIRDAADEGYDVANVSIEGCGGDTVENAVDYAHNNGTTVVAAAGNQGCCDSVTAPGRFDNSIAVSNITDQDDIAGGSSRGPEVDIAAPGSSIPSTWNNGHTGTKSGTSMAAPHVAGAVALLKANGVAHADIQSELENTAEDIGLTDNEQGEGLLDVANALGYDSANDLLAVRTTFADAEYTEAELSGRVDELTGNDTADVQFEYREVGAGSWTQTPAVTQTGTGSFSETVTGLAQDTDYEFRAQATVFELSESWHSIEYGAIETFSTANNPDPTASFTHDPTVPDPTESVRFDASGSMPGEQFGIDQDDFIVSYEWDFTDDGSIDDTGQVVTHSYPTPGTVTARLRVTDDFGQTDETTVEIRVNAPPEASFTWTPSVPNEGDDIMFDASGSVDPDVDIADYHWDFGDGNTASGVNVTHNYGPAGAGNWGNFDVTLTVTDTDGATDEITETVRVNAYPLPDFGFSPSLPDEGEQISFDAAASSDPDGSIVSYEWDFDNDSVFDDGTGVTATQTFPDGGDKTVGLRVTDDDGASAETTRTFHVNHIPTASFTVSPDPVVRNETASFDASGSNDEDGTVDRYEWDWDYDGTFTVDDSTTSPTIDHTFTTGGEHTVALRVTDNDGATSDPAIMDLTVHIRVAVDIQPNGDGPNAIHPDQRGNVPVAVLQTAAFDPPARLDPGAVRFGDPDDVGFDALDMPEGGATPAHPGGHVEDVDGDSDDDSLFHFPMPDADFEANDTAGKLVGLTYNGVPIFGSDSIKTGGGGGP